jgi:long-chain fatty acid transport protein
MKLLKAAIVAMALSGTQVVWAGGINTNTNMSTAFGRNLSREGAISIDGVYFNPAGATFLSPGLHLSINWQLITQHRYIDNNYELFANNTEKPTTNRNFKGHSLAPFFPTVQAAYNWHRFSFQANAGVGGGGGKCTFDDGLGSFEKIVSETALAASGLASTVDGSLFNALSGACVPEQMAQAMVGKNGFSSDQYFGKQGKYSAQSYMRGRQYYYGVSLGVGYKLTDDLSVFAGARGVYASCNYYGYVRNIKVGNMPLYQVLDPTKTNSADIELSCDQSGFGVTPILGIDYRLGKWNFSAKYEFKTRMRLKNSSVNQFPSIGNLSDNLAKALNATLQNNNMTAKQALAITEGTLKSKEVTGTMTALKAHFDQGIKEATGEYEDGKSIPADLPGIVAVGVGYTPNDALRLTAGFHYYFDKQAHAYNNRNKLLKRGTMEYSAGVEYDPIKLITVSAGYQRTNYGLSDEYMDDKSFVVSSNSIGTGFMLHLSKKTRVNVSYFHTFYETKNTEKTVQLTEKQQAHYVANYSRSNNVFGASLELDF